MARLQAVLVGKVGAPVAFIYSTLIYYFWQYWVFGAVQGLSLAATSWDCSSLWGLGFSRGWLLSLHCKSVRAHGLQEWWYMGLSSSKDVKAEPVSCALAGSFFFTGPPRESLPL